MSRLISNTLNVLENWRQKNNEKDALNQEAKDVLTLNSLENKKLRSEGEEKRGNLVGKAGASGIKVASFNDYLLSEQLKKEKEAYQNDLKANSQARALRESAKNKEDKFRADTLASGAGLLSDFFGF